MTDNFKIDFIGIGAMKAATTWIFSCLQEHPEICTSSKKEINFFNKPYNYRKGLDYYQNYFKHCPTGKIKGEFSAFYLESSRAPALIHKHFPEVKLIACLRNPIGRAYSHYKFNVSQKGRMSVYDDFGEAIRNNFVLIEKGRYYKLLKRYFDLFPEENILVLFYKDLKQDKKKFVQNIYQFLELKDKDFVPSVLTQRKNVTGKSVAQLKFPTVNRFFYRARNKFNRGTKTGRGLFWVMDRLGLREPIKRILKANKEMTEKDKVEINSYSSMKQADRDYLKKIYQEDIEKLEELLGKNLDFWR